MQTLYHFFFFLNNRKCNLAFFQTSAHEFPLTTVGVEFLSGLHLTKNSAFQDAFLAAYTKTND